MQTRRSSYGKELAESDPLLCGAFERTAAPNGERENRFIESAQSIVRRVYNGRAIRIKRKGLSMRGETKFSGAKQKNGKGGAKCAAVFFGETEPAVTRRRKEQRAWNRGPSDFHR